ncbi:MAG: flagellar protein export ATPase FliI [Rickettsiales bacterium]|nr:flagellar protein export ATPase FliI [Rickettsiales bacterium]
MVSQLQLDEIQNIQDVTASGTVTAVMGMLIECTGIERLLSVGSRCRVIGAKSLQGIQPEVLTEVVGFRDNKALLMPFSNLEGIGPGAKVSLESNISACYPSDAWLGRVINALGEPVDGKGPLPKGTVPYSLRNSPPQAHERMRVKGKLDVGVRALNTFLTTCHGQRMGIFAGSGVGKSVLMSMLARNSLADVNVIGLIGERSRELQEFIEDDLGEEGLKRSVIIVATSSEYALLRKQSALMTLSVAEYFRDKGLEVLCMMDSVTRFAMAQREIGLSAGEPPTSKGYTPTVFAELPKLLERAGPGKKGQGNITGLFTVLVEGDDTNEPISDAVRGILDGHIVMERSIAERGRFPAINVLKSVSRTMPDCNTEAESMLVQTARTLMSTYEDMAEMIRLGAYRKGSDAGVDKAIQYYPAIEKFLAQRMEENTSLEEGYNKLAEVLGIKDWKNAKW